MRRDSKSAQPRNALEKISKVLVRGHHRHPMVVIVRKFKNSEKHKNFPLCTKAAERFFEQVHVEKQYPQSADFDWEVPITFWVLNY